METAANQSLRQLSRMAEQGPEAFTELERVWHCDTNGEAMCDGPVVVTRSILRWWLHEIRQGMRLAEWSRAGNRRGDMSGIESTAGIDKATIKALSTKIPPEQKHNLRELLCGCVWTQKRQFDCHRAESPMCLFLLGRNLKTKTACSGDARSGRLLREGQVPSRHERLLWPWTSRCGIFVDREAEAWADAAELLAVIAAMRVQEGNLEIRSDSEYVVRIPTRLIQGERQLNTDGNADMWVEFVCELGLKTTRRLHIPLGQRTCENSYRQGLPLHWTEGK